MASANSQGATISLEEAAALKIFHPGGRSEFFQSSWMETAVCSRRGGYFRTCLGLGPWGILALFALLGTLALWVIRRIGKPEPRVLRLLGGLLAAGTLLFLLAYAVAFKAHLPSRYARMALILLVPVALAMLCQLPDVWGRGWAIRLGRMGTAAGLAAILIYVLVGWRGHYIGDSHREISAAIRAMPRQSVIAGLCGYADSIPTFAARPVYVSRELSVPYKTDYYALVSARMATQARLYAGPVDGAWLEALKTSGIDAFLVTPNDAECWSRLGRSFESVPTWPGASVFDTRAEATGACLMQASGPLRLIDAGCFARLGAAGRQP